MTHSLQLYYIVNIQTVQHISHFYFNKSEVSLNILSTCVIQCNVNFFPDWGDLNPGDHVAGVGGWVVEAGCMTVHREGERSSLVQCCSLVWFV